jgi:competence protein ComEA
MRQFNGLIATLIVLISTTLALREIDYNTRLSQRKRLITVYVVGEVRHPGTATLPEGARRLHAVNRCGGLTPTADIEELEPAKPLCDGETLNVPQRRFPTGVEPGPAVRSPLPPPSQESRRAPAQSLPRTPADLKPNSNRTTLVNLNQATAEELQKVPGLGPVLAQRIIEARNQQPGGTFGSLEDLTAIRGIKRKTMERLTPYLELEGI